MVLPVAGQNTSPFTEIWEEINPKTDVLSVA